MLSSSGIVIHLSPYQIFLKFAATGHIYFDKTLPYCAGIKRTDWALSKTQDFDPRVRGEISFDYSCTCEFGIWYSI
jgi:hypothetical protein